MLPDSKLASNYVTKYRNLAPSSTGSLVKASPCEVHSIYLSNTDTKAVFVKFYDKATAATSSDTPVFTLPVNTIESDPLSLPEPWYFATGLSIRATGAQADNDTTAPTANTITVNIAYK